MSRRKFIRVVRGIRGVRGALGGFGGGNSGGCRGAGVMALNGRRSLTLTEWQSLVTLAEWQAFTLFLSQLSALCH